MFTHTLTLTHCAHTHTYWHDCYYPAYILYHHHCCRILTYTIYTIYFHPNECATHSVQRCLQIQSYSLHSNLGAHQEWQKSQWPNRFYSKHVCRLTRRNSLLRERLLPESKRRGLRMLSMPARGVPKRFQVQSTHRVQTVHAWLLPGKQLSSEVRGVPGRLQTGRSRKRILPSLLPWKVPE